MQLRFKENQLIRCNVSIKDIAQDARVEIDPVNLDIFNMQISNMI